MGTNYTVFLYVHLHTLTRHTYDAGVGYDGNQWYFHVNVDATCDA